MTKFRQHVCMTVSINLKDKCVHIKFLLVRKSHYSKIRLLYRDTLVSVTLNFKFSFNLFIAFKSIQYNIVS